MSNFIEAFGRKILVAIAGRILDNKSAIFQFAVEAAAHFTGSVEEKRAFVQKSLDKVQIEARTEFQENLTIFFNEYDLPGLSGEAEDTVEADLIKTAVDTFNGIWDQYLETKVLSLIA